MLLMDILLAVRKSNLEQPFENSRNFLFLQDIFRSKWPFSAQNQNPIKRWLLTPNGVCGEHRT